MTKGITITQEGIGIDQAHDSQKVLDSRWRYFEIILEEEVILPTMADFENIHRTIFTHNLGFVPAFDCYDIDTDDYVTGNTTGGLRASKTEVYFDGFSQGSVYSNHLVLLRIYNVPIIEEYTAPIAATLPGKSSSDSSIGMKITNFPSVLDKRELSKYALNTTGKALSIQKTGTVIASADTNFQAVITHNIGNPPTYLTAEADPNLTYVCPIDPSFVPVLASATGTTMTFAGAQSALIGTFAYIIFKELSDFVL